MAEAVELRAVIPGACVHDVLSRVGSVNLLSDKRKRYL